MSREWIDVPLRITDKIGDFAVWAGTRLLVATPALIFYSWKQLSRLSLHCAEMAERSYSKILIIYDSLPYGGMAGTKLIDVEARTISQAIAPITDLLLAIEEKELMVIGEKGTGKSTLAQYLAYSMGGHIRVYEPEGTPEDWTGLEVIGKGEDWDGINEGMAADLDHISNQMKLRREKGDAALAGSDRVIIGEEYPEIAAKCETSEEWLDRHARRGRKAKVRLILLSQYDQVSAWKLEGRSDLLDCFFRLRLGKKAIKHAQKLKREDLVQWLRSGRSHALLDDDPIILPEYREMQRVIQGFQRGYNLLPAHFQPTSNLLPENGPRRTGESGFQPVEGLQKELSESLKSPENQGFGPWESRWESSFWEVWQAIQRGESDYWIGRNIFGIQGGTSYQKLCDRLDEVRSSEKR